MTENEVWVEGTQANIARIAREEFPRAEVKSTTEPGFVSRGQRSRNYRSVLISQGQVEITASAIWRGTAKSGGDFTRSWRFQALGDWGKPIVLRATKLCLREQISGALWHAYRRAGAHLRQVIKTKRQLATRDATVREWRQELARLAPVALEYDANEHGRTLKPLSHLEKLFPRLEMQCSLEDGAFSAKLEIHPRTLEDLAVMIETLTHIHLDRLYHFDTTGEEPHRWSFIHTLSGKDDG